MRRGIEFEAGGTRHTLRFDVNALCALEAEFGCPVEDVVKRLAPDNGKVSMTDIRAAFRAGLGVEDMTTQQAGAIMADLGLEDAMAKISEALSLAFPDPEAAARGEKPRGKPRAAA